jgi:hypothetical protein
LGFAGSAARGVSPVSRVRRSGGARTRKVTDDFPGRVSVVLQFHFVFDSRWLVGFDVTTGTWNSNGVSGQMLSTSTVTIQGCATFPRPVPWTASTTWASAERRADSQVERPLSGRQLYTGSHAECGHRRADLGIQLRDGVLFHRQQRRHRNDDFAGIAEAGTNTAAGQSYSQGIASLDLSLNRSNVTGGPSATTP